VKAARTSDSDFTVPRAILAYHSPRIHVYCIGGCVHKVLKGHKLPISNQFTLPVNLNAQGSYRTHQRSSRCASVTVW
jgi:hypothetical protein